MKLATTSPLGEPGFTYEQMLWGDLICGTKEQIQRIGLAVGMAFPGEPDGPKMRLNTTDHRGFAVKIEVGSHKGAGLYVASIPFPGRAYLPPKRWTNFAPGVKRSSDRDWYDEYVGTPTALAAAGLVRLDQLPGQPGMRKTTVTIYPDGTLPSGPKTVSREPGAKQISRASKNTYNVSVRIETEEEQRRDTECRRKENEWENRMRSLPRPAPLIALDACSSVKAKPAPKYRADGNVLYLLPRGEGRTAP